MTKTFLKAFFVMELWQTGNVGSNNIAKVKGQPEGGFATQDLALSWMIDNIGKSVYHVSFHSYTILPIYEPKPTNNEQ